MKPPHGTYTRYQNHDCRCDDCRTANTTYQRDRGGAGYKKDLCDCGKPKGYRAERCQACCDAERAAPHGTESRYCAGCRCSDCRAAATAARKVRRERQAMAA